MDITPRSRRWRWRWRWPRRAGGAAVAAGWLLAGAWAADVALVKPNEPISLDAQSSEFDYKNNILMFRHVRVRQGDLQVDADQATATGLSFDNSRWDFRGAVRITMPNGFLASDAATIHFANNQLATALASGTPASFEQKRGNGVARGRAGRIDYDFPAGTVRLSEDAWLSDGNNEIAGKTLIYSMRDQRVLANPGDQGDERVHIVINPRRPPGETQPAP